MSHLSHVEPGPDPQRSVVWITIDGLGARYLGAYGNDWQQTPNLDRWAAAGILFENAMAEQPLVWLKNSGSVAGTDAASGGGTVGGTVTDLGDWGESLATLPGYKVLVTDDASLARAAESSFDQVVLVELPPPDAAITDWTETQTAAFFAQAAAMVESLPDRTLLWIHSAGFENAWDAPQDWRWDLRGEEDPEPTEELVAPDSATVWNLDELDPDLRCGWLQAYGAQLRVIDQCLGMVFELIESHWLAGRAVLAVVQGVRGYPLGEHGIVGHTIPTAHDEAIHVPLILRGSGAADIGVRRLSLIKTSEPLQWADEWLNGSALEWAQRWPVIPSPAEPPIVGQQGPWQFVRSHQWKWICDGQFDRLYAKPDDRWERNDVSARCREVIEEFHRGYKAPAL